MSQNEAVDAAVEYCIRNHILEDILRAHRAEVTDMLLTEYDEAFHIENERKLSFEKGRDLEKKRADAAEKRAGEMEELLAEERKKVAEEKKKADDSKLFASVLCLKLKGYDDSEIAGELELNEEKVKEILKEALA